jgi:hypothetical protein
MIGIARHRTLSWTAACSVVEQGVEEKTGHGRQDKSPDVRLGHVVGCIEGFGHWDRRACWRPHRKVQRIQHIERHRSFFRGYRSP